MSTIKFEILIGRTLTEIVGGVNDNSILFVDTYGNRYQLWHDQDCCESVYVQDIIGDIQDLLNSPITLAEEVSSHDKLPDGETSDYNPYESFTWTFYRLATIKGYVTIRFIGESNGYYSESVDFVKLD